MVRDLNAYIIIFEPNEPTIELLNRFLLNYYIQFYPQVLNAGIQGYVESYSAKIKDLTPHHKDFSLLFELTQIVKKDNSKLDARIVDDTGIVDACFDKYADRLEEGVVYLMTHLKVKVIDSHIQVQMSKDSSVTKEADILGFKDKSNDISKKYYAPKSKIEEIVASDPSFNKTSGLIQVEKKKEEVLIPLSKEQAFEQIRIKRQFEDNKRIKANNYNRKEQEKHQDGKALKYKQKDVVAANDQKLNSSKKPPNEAETARKKTKSLMYRQKVEAPESQKKVVEYQRPKFVEKKENRGQCIDLISVVAHVGEHVNLKVWVSSNKRNQKNEEYERMIADSTGSVWLKLNKLNLEGQQWYEIDNLEVMREDGRLILRQTEFSEARQLEGTYTFNMKSISSK